MHQSQFCPWLPYFFKIITSDLFIVLDNVQYQKNGVQNRNQIKTPQGTAWLTLPIKNRFGNKINEVEIDSEININKLLRTLEMNYKKSRYFNFIFEKIKQELTTEASNKLNVINLRLLKLFVSLLDIKTPIVYSSSIETKTCKDDLVIELLLNSKATEYLTGKGALAYMNLEKFHNSNIKVYTYKFVYSEYEQQWNKIGFLPNLSVIDLLFNNLENALEYITKNGLITRIK